MVAIFTGQGNGAQRGSGAVLGGVGLMGSGTAGRSGQQVSLNAANGNLLIQQADAMLVGRGTDVAVARSYNSKTDPNQNDGGGPWTQNSRKIDATEAIGQAGGKIKLYDTDGSVITYRWDGSGYRTTAGAGAYDRITRVDGKWVRTDGDTLATEEYGEPYAALYNLTKSTDANGNTTQYSYAGRAKISRITSSDGSWIEYTYDINGNAVSASVTYQDLTTNTAKTQRFTYTYDNSSRLVSATIDLSPEDNSIADGRVYTTTYTYIGISRLVSRIDETDGSRLEISYDSQNRVTSFTETVSSNTTRTTTLAYGTGYTAITDAAGQTTRLDYDADGALTSIETPPVRSGAPSQVMRFAYTADGDVSSITDGLGKVTSFTFDGNGNILTQTDRLGNVVTRTYDARNRMLTETRTGSNADSAAATLTTRYVYNSAGQMRFAIGTGGEVSEQRYNATGELSVALRYTDQRYDLSGLSNSTAPTETQLANWVFGLGDPTAVEQTVYGYDARGNLMQQINYAASTSPGEPSTDEGSRWITYTYDQAGRLLHRTQAGHNTEHFVYDGLGRVVSSTDIQGGVTSIAFDDANTRTVVTLANGLVQTSTYSKTGELLVYSEAGEMMQTATTTYGTDQVGRRRLTAGPTGTKSYQVYDRIGRKVADVGELGEMTEYRYDAGNRLIATIRYATKASSSALGLAAAPNANPDISTIRPASASGDLWTWQVYDNEGRVIEQIDGAGNALSYSYDASGRLVSTIEYATALTASQVATFRTTPPSAPILPPSSTTADRVTRTFYDGNGRVIGALDGAGYLSISTYDAAGNRIAETRYAAATAMSQRAGGTLTALLASFAPGAADRTTRYVYDRQGLLRFEIDPLHNVKGYTYSTWTWGSATGQTRSTIEYAGVIAPQSRYTLTSVRDALSAAGLTSNAANRESFAVHDATGRVVYAIAADGAVQNYRYNNMGDVVATTRFAVLRPTSGRPTPAELDEWAAANRNVARDRTTRNYYSDARQLRYTVDAEGYVTRNDYDALGRPRETFRYSNRVTVDDTTTAAALAAMPAGAAVSTAVSYDVMGRVATRRGADQVVHNYVYNVNGTLQYDIAAPGNADERRTQFVYDATGRATSTIEGWGTAEQTTRQTTYNSFGERTGETDTLGRTTSFTLDRLGRVLTRTDAASGAVTYTYNAFGEQVQATDARGNVSYSYYDIDGQLTATRDAENYVTEYGYNAFGELATTTRRANRATNTASASTIPQVAASASDAVTKFGYDKLGRATSTTDAEGFTETTTYNAFGQVSRVQNKIGGAVDYGYDRRGLLQFEYVAAATFNGAGTQTATGYYRHVYKYDARGNRTQDVEAQGLAEQRITNYAFDAGNRLISKSGDAVLVGLPGQTQTVVPTETYTYDLRGNMVLTVAADGARTQRYYDRLDRVIAEARSFGAASANVATLTTQAYDGNGNLTRSRRYDATIAMPAVGGAAPAAPAGNYRETTYVYDNLNRRTSTTIAGIRTGAWNGTQYATAVTSITTTTAYDANGNVVRATAGDGGETFSYYDRAGRRIAQVDAEKYLTTWTLDAEGNALLERRSAARVASAAIGTAPTLPANDAADRVTQFTYDRNGRRRTEGRRNVQSWSVAPTTGALTTATGTATITYAYNGLGEVTRKTEATGDFVEYTYDNSGRLTRETRAPFLDQTGATVRPAVDYRYDGLGDLVRTVESGSRITSYTYGAGGRLLSSTDAGGTTRNYSYDVVGRKTAESFNRYDSAGVLRQEATTYGYDTAGQLVSQGQAQFVTGTGWTAVGDTIGIHYNAHGQVVARSLNTVVQERFDYDNAGRVWRSNSDDGVWRVYLHDGAGNQTLKIESGGADLSTLTLDQVIALTTNQGAVAVGLGGNGQTVATFTTYDRRGMSLATMLPARSGTADTAMTKSRTLNAFGEIATETDGAGNTKTYTYNALGRRIVVTHPLVGVTGENGTTVQANPTERSYYDISGRLVAVQNANGATTTRVLQAGTGYGDADALIVAEWHPDGGVIRNGYDVFGDLRLVTDEVGQKTAMSYDGAGRLVSMTRADGSIDSYGYDVLGQRITHANSAYTTTEATDYDVQGRVIATRTFGGDTTTTSYVWDATLTAAGLGTRGGHVETTTFINGRTIVESADTFAHIVSRTDMGSHVFSYRYDLAGRLAETGTGDERKSYIYANTGLVTSVSVGRGDEKTAGSDYLTTTYSYDLRGLKTAEVTRSNKVKEKFVNGSAQADHTFQVLQNATATYDALGRMTRWTDQIDRDGQQQVPANSIDWLYDAAGNIRRASIAYNNIDQNGNFVAGGAQDQWFRYDAMNRVATHKGSLVGGAIVRSAIGSDITYDAAGRRATVTTGAATAAKRESYVYNLGGQLSTVSFGTLSSTGSYQASGGSSFTYDAAGRMTRQVDSNASVVAYDRSVTYNEKGQATSETVNQRRGSDTITANTTTEYGTGAAYALGAPVSITTAGTRNGQTATTSRTSYTYEYFDTPLQSTISYQADINSTAPATTTQVSYTGQGVLFSAAINDGRPRRVDYQADALGQVIRRDESDNNPNTGDPHEIWLRFDGRELGHITNNGTLETDYATSVANRTAATAPGPFRNGGASSSVAEFNTGYQPINSFDQGSDGGIYTVQDGDTLQSIAQRLWGDENLWYRLAQANGLSTNAQLVEGQVLALPRGVVRNANSTDTFRPYDAAAAVGDILPDETSPTQPQPQARRRRNKCGVFGAILLAVVAIAVTALIAAPLATALGGGIGGAIAGGAIAGAAGSVASQAVGVATGIQDRFSFKGVALAALAGGVGGGASAAFGGGAAGSATGGNFVGNVAVGAATNALTQGVGLVTGLQSRFDFAGVAAAGLGAGIGRAAGARAQNARVAGFGVRVASATAGGIAGAAAQSLVNGDSFGDNLVAALPSIIGQTVGGAIEDALRTRTTRSSPDVRNNQATAGSVVGSPDNISDFGPSDEGGAQQGDIVVIAPSSRRSYNPTFSEIAHVAAMDFSGINDSASTVVNINPGSNPYPVNAELSGLTLRQLQAARNEFTSYAQNKGFTDYEQRLLAFDKLEAQASAREALGSAQAEDFDREVVSYLSFPIITALTTASEPVNLAYTAIQYGLGNISASEAVFSTVPGLGSVAGRGFGIAEKAESRVLFGQKRVGPAFGVKGRPDYLAGRTIEDVASDLRLGVLQPDQLPIDAFRVGPNLVSANTRSLAALSEAGLSPTVINEIQPTSDLLRRLRENPITANAPLPGPRVPVTPSQKDLNVLRVIDLPR